MKRGAADHLSDATDVREGKGSTYPTTVQVSDEPQLLYTLIGCPGWH